MKYITIFFIFLFILACNNNNDKNNKNDEIIDNENDSKDLFSNKEIVFSKLEFDSNSYSNENRYYIKNLDISFSPPINSVQLSEEEKERVIEQTSYFKDYFYTDSLFIDEKIKTSCLVGYMEKDNDKLNSFINLLRNMKEDESIVNFTEEYYTINDKKNIQFRINIDNALYWFYVIFESKNGYYLILNYTFPVPYLEDSVIRIANSLNSVNF